MSFFPKTYTAKNGEQIIIREAISDDASALLQLKLSYIKDTTTIPLFDDEYPDNQEEEKQLIERYQLDQKSILLLAIHNKQVIGNIDLTANWRKKMDHTAMIGMGIDTQWQNQGVGTLLLKNVISWAKNTNILRILWLEVYATNLPGITLYKKMNFIEVGKVPDFFIEKDNYIDKIIMYQKI